MFFASFSFDDFGRTPPDVHLFLPPSLSILSQLFPNQSHTCSYQGPRNRHHIDHRSPFGTGIHCWVGGAEEGAVLRPLEVPRSQFTKKHLGNKSGTSVRSNAPPLLSSWTQKEFQTGEEEQSGQRRSSVQEVEHGGGPVSSSSNLQGGDPLPPGPLGQTPLGHSRRYVRAKCTAL